MYRYEAINGIMQGGSEVECSSTKLFEVTSSEIATITSLDVDGQAGILRIEARVSGNGDYEYALDDINGPYQDSAVFDNVPAGSHTVHVRDRNGCGIVSQSIDEQTALDGFPRFFTPNGDGFNDFWQYVPPPALEEIPLNNIQVYDRYGKLLANFGPDSAGWDGTFNGNPLPSDDYWFRAEVDSQGELKGHFTLKR
jgi:gliding motility-associated-like protein